ncbi:serine/threonine-protein phosphatase PGAM5, mitochondrial-like isoform X2 [Amphiura filiformis]|uniref:serine/threonine-protein phosphatase PGAM5, mitochondrial-like isoform X2 n=1 Tax=Amphiura filiformis TaxID=82378 RepID=UPI003B2217E0
MPGFHRYARLAKIVCGVAATSGVISAVVVKNSTISTKNSDENNLMPSVLAAWTTNFHPSVKWDSNWDRRDPESLLKPEKSQKGSSDTTDNGPNFQAELNKLKPVANRHIFMIRHGHYNVDGETDEQRVLTALGQEQAELTGLRLKELSFPFTIMTNSSMSRAIQTADIIAKSLPDVPRDVCDMLREGAPIPPEPPIGHWKPELKFFEDGARIEAAFRKYFHRADPDQAKDSYELLVCHANVIRYFVCRVMQFPPEAWLRISLHHGSITWVTIRPSGRVTLRTLGDTGHMPPAKITSA